MYPGSPNPAGNFPAAANNFRTPKAVNHKNRVNSRDRESGASQESTIPANFRAFHSNPSNVPLQSSQKTEQTPWLRNRQDDVRHPRNFNSDSSDSAHGTVSYSNTRQPLYSNDVASENLRAKPVGGMLPVRDGFEVCPGSHGYVVGCGRLLNNSLTDADKLQFNSLGRHSTDRISRWSSLGQAAAFDVGQNLVIGGHRVSNGHLIPERDGHPFEYDAVESVQRGHYAGSSSDLTAWLQQHKQNLRQQQQLSDNIGQNQLTSRGHYGSTGNLVDSSERVELLKQAADDIIREKDGIIERQKARIIQLETNAVKSKFSKLELGSSSEQILEKKLGAVEYELQEAKRSSELLLREKENVILTLKEQSKSKDLIINDWSTKCSIQKTENDRLQNEIDRHNRYLSELPTAEEHTNNLSLINQLKADNSLLKDGLSQLENKLKQSASDLQSKEMQMKSLEESNREQSVQNQALETCNKELSEKLSLRVDLLELQHLQKENRRLASDLEKARKLMDALNNQLRQQVSRHKSEIASLADSLDQKVAAVKALEQEIHDHEMVLKNYEENMKELSAENQSLTVEKMKFEEELKELRQPDRAEQQKIQALLFKELNISFGDMSRLVKVCLEKMNGQDPNLGLLLGIRDYSAGGETESVTNMSAGISLNSLKSQLSQARNLRHEIDKLREIIADKFAEDMGRRLTCNPQ